MSLSSRRGLVDAKSKSGEEGQDFSYDLLTTLKSTYLDCMRLIEMQIRNLGARTSIGDKLTWQNGLADGF